MMRQEMCHSGSWFQERANSASAFCPPDIHSYSTRKSHPCFTAPDTEPIMSKQQLLRPCSLPAAVPLLQCCQREPNESLRTNKSPGSSPAGGIPRGTLGERCRVPSLDSVLLHFLQSPDYDKFTILSYFVSWIHMFLLRNSSILADYT